MQTQVISSWATDVMEAAAVASDPRCPMIRECMEKPMPHARELPSIGSDIRNQSFVTAAENHLKPCQSGRMLSPR